MRLIGAELLKLRTTSTWWVFGLIMLPLWGLAMLYNWGTANITRTVDPGAGVPPDQAEQIRVANEAVNVASNLYTTGQFLGVLVVMLLGAIVVTNEYFHLTATTTFLTTPRRERVVLAKLVTAVLVGLAFWLVTTLLNLIVAPLVLRALELPVQLSEPAVWRAIGLNALAFALWAVLGVGAGVLIRSQLAATLTLALVYVIGTTGAELGFYLLTEYVAEWFENLQVLVPTIASRLMISGTELPGNPPRWVGGVVLIGYAVIMGTIGTLIMKRRDIS